MRDRTAEVRERGVSDHVLVCTHKRESEYAACAEAHGPAVYEAVAEWFRDRDVFWSRVQVARTSCLGLCSAEGTAVAIHPRGRFYSDVRPADVTDLLASEFGPDATRLGLAGADESDCSHCFPPNVTSDGGARR
ncbi:(2Fe-2S) ferredoxin domain-containing protein [Halobellus rubicundus]|uniref:Ferredoxin n=1 Tax=Halobellus rubicundus TaxID=2996466 RepID=A0ABD5MGH4_9EURY